jgi:hypothetical protein
MVVYGLSQVDKMIIPQETTNRLDLWIKFINQTKPKAVAEVGVWKGEYAAAILERCPSIEKYTMIDPWAKLSDWNKPFNVEDNEFKEVYDEAILKTKFASDKLQILRGRTKDVINEIEDDSLDFVYIDGDHTLRGITLDLILTLPKVKSGGFIAGDDFTLSPWQHSSHFEPTLVCPFAVYFAEAMNLPIHVLPHKQFLISKSSEGFSFTDTTGKYSDLSLNKIPATSKESFRK